MVLVCCVVVLITDGVGVLLRCSYSLWCWYVTSLFLTLMVLVCCVVVLITDGVGMLCRCSYN